MSEMIVLRKAPYPIEKDVPAPAIPDMCAMGRLRRTRNAMQPGDSVLISADDVLVALMHSAFGRGNAVAKREGDMFRIWMIAK